MADRQNRTTETKEDRIWRELLAAIKAQQDNGRIRKVVKQLYQPFEHKQD
ncbi:hypothetical protein Slin15195_G049700 [Septoria linicola]|uniref:Uncharacterized protein n=1 Tax=Septoria linicola TaxID=215465 RepID=A0A9Q9ATH0_9PEZI|nr:hypothetical protein Slin14017_G053230 [Septoria linicola]USW51651.1 hypothetical protein Slin15195_G049700 [Septoria linicola]